LYDKYALCSCGASMGEGYGPMLIAREPCSLSDLSDKTIAVPGKLTSAYLAEADCVVIATAHAAIDLGAVVEHADLVVDLRNAVRHRLGGPSGSIPPNVDVL
jgi:1,4-dihydroxy-6-naphthoate synthase